MQCGGFIPFFLNINIIKMLKIKNGLSFDGTMWYNKVTPKRNCITFRCAYGRSLNVKGVKSLKNSVGSVYLFLKTLHKFFSLFNR